MKQLVRQSIKRISLMTALLCLAFQSMAWAQSTAASFSCNETYKHVEVVHRSSAWHSAGRPKWVTNHPNSQLQGKLQATYVYADTIYMKKGTSYTLTLPDMLTEVIKGQSKNKLHINAGTYQRWYNYYTDGLFETGQPERSDLLTRTPDQSSYNKQQAAQPFRLKNGYVGSPFTGLAGRWDNVNSTLFQMDFYYPTDQEYQAWNLKGQSPDNNLYWVAIDISNYSDGEVKNHQQQLGDNGFTEPTLTHRIIFYLYGVDADDVAPSAFESTMKRADYQGGKVTDKAQLNGKRFWEEYDITYPIYHFSYFTRELVALTKDAEAYAVPDNQDSKETPLDVTLLPGEHTTIDLPDFSRQLTGKNRIISLDYLTVDETGTMPINFKKAGTQSGCTATLLVTKTVNGTTYNLARFNLTFMDGFHQLTQSQLKMLDEKSKPDNVNWVLWKDYGYRTPKYLESHYDELASITFDHPELNNPKFLSHLSDFWGWENSSYGFYNGNPSDLDWSGPDRNRPQWGNFAVTNSYIEPNRTPGATDQVDYAREGNTHHLYIDASDRPGVIARLPFKTKSICPGSEILVSAMVMSVVTGDVANDPAMLFTVMGVKKTAGKVSYTPIYRYQTGQIFNRHVAPGGARSQNVPGWDKEWKQVFFSFPNSNTAYDEYLLQIENNSSSTVGGDMCVDEIRVFGSRPRVDVNALGPVCDQTDRKVQLFFPWSSLVYDESTSTGETKQLAFCVIDTLNYHLALDGEKLSIPEAIQKAQVRLVNGQKVCLASYNNLFDRNQTVYNKETSDAPAGSNGPIVLHRMISPSKGMAINLPGEFKTNRGYKLLVVEYHSGDIQKLTFPDPDEPGCAIVGAFSLESQNQLKMNAEIYGDLELCEGQTYNFQVQMRAYDEATGSFTEVGAHHNLYHDWFIGPTAEFLLKVGGVSLKESLEHFRAVYPDADNKAVLDGEVTAKESFTEPMLTLIKNYMQSHIHQVSTAVKHKLVLYQTSMDIQVTKPLDLVVMPIRNAEVDAEYKGLCWNYTTRTIDPKGKAPSLFAGFHDVHYPEYYKQVVRLGLKQMKETQGGACYVRIPLRDTQPLHSEAVLEEENTQKDRQRLFLIDSNDPAYQQLFHGKAFTEYDYPVGTVQRLRASEELDKTGSSYMDISFDLTGQLTAGEGSGTFKFTPHEGYHYVLAFHFVEKGPYMEEELHCPGRQIIWIKVVPEYMRWVGNTTKVSNEDWSNRNNWVRAKSSQLNNPAGYDDYEMLPPGLAPMDFTNIIIPKGGTLTLKPVEYDPALSHEGSAHRIVKLNPSASVNGYRDMEFDLAVKRAEASVGDGVKYDCRTYYINEVAQVHFEPQSEMIHGEHLTYQKAWVDYELDKGRWYTLASPFQADNMFAGDWFTDRVTAREGEIYFYDTFKGGPGLPAFNSQANSRVNPTVYQRTWDQASHLVLPTVQGRDVAVKGNWSSLYNDVTVPYDQCGFSLKLQDYSNAEYGNKALFRFPKSDAAYAYYSYQNGVLTESGKQAPVRRASAIGQLQVSRLATEKELTVSLRASQAVTVDKESYYYFLVANPFMSHLDMDAFFEANKQLEPKYWMVTANTQSVALQYDDKNWIASGAAQKRSVAPLQSFFVKMKAAGASSAEKKVTVRFTADMQTKGAKQESLRSAQAMQSLAVTATEGDKESRALVVYRADADAGFADAEDAELFMDSNLSEVPLVYTVAGSQAVSIHTTGRMDPIPLGVFCQSAGKVALTFEGLDCFSEVSLCDNQNGHEIPLLEGSTVVVDGNSHGRYFLRVGNPTSSEALTIESLHIFSVEKGKLIVASTASAIQQIRVYGIDGRLVQAIPAVDSSRREIALPSGVYIVQVQSSAGMQSKKVVVQ